MRMAVMVTVTVTVTVMARMRNKPECFNSLLIFSFENSQ